MFVEFDGKGIRNDYLVFELSRYLIARINRSYFLVVRIFVIGLKDVLIVIRTLKATIISFDVIFEVWQISNSHVGEVLNLSFYLYLSLIID